MIALQTTVLWSKGFTIQILFYVYVHVEYTIFDAWQKNRLSDLWFPDGKVVNYTLSRLCTEVFNQ